MTNPAVNLRVRAQVLPKRHLDFTSAARCEFIELSGHLDDARFTEARQFRCALDGVLFKYCRDDDVRDCCLRHSSILRLCAHHAAAFRRSASLGSRLMTFICSVMFHSGPRLNGFLPSGAALLPGREPVAPPPALGSNR